jgi:DNA-binding NarL/FixJ family response regulator
MMPVETRMPHPHNGAPGSLRVLVVDDHPLFRKGLLDVLAEAPGVSVCGEAATVAEALAATAACQPDVAIVDLSLGDESGLDLVSTLARIEPAVRVLVISGHDERVHADRALKAGALGYIMKDKSAAEMIAAVRRVGAGRSYVSAETAERILMTLGSGQRRALRSPLEALSDREQQVLTLMGRGVSTRDIAAQLQLSVKTVESHYAHIKDKLGLRNSRELMRVAVTFSEDHP